MPMVAVPRQFEWDDAKAEANRLKHGIRFEEAVAVFLDPDRVDFDASRDADGEPRRKVVGSIEGYLFCVVYTARGEVTRLISARRANALEVRRHGSSDA